VRLRAFDASKHAYATRRIGTLRTLRDRALLLGQRPLTTTDESSTDRKPGGDSCGLLAAWGRPEGAFSLVRAVASLCPAYKPTRHHHRHQQARKLLGHQPITDRRSPGLPREQMCSPTCVPERTLGTRVATRRHSARTQRRSACMKEWGRVKVARARENDAGRWRWLVLGFGCRPWRCSHQGSRGCEVR
jgi:hypothetical protein